MALPVVPNVYRCAVRQSFAGRTCVTVLNVQKATGYSASLEGIGDDVANNWRDHILPLQSPAVRLDGVDVRDVGVDEGDIVSVAATGATLTGSGATSITYSGPPQVCYLVKLRTGSGGRGGRGRWYLPGVDEGKVDEAGKLTAGFVASANTGLANFLSGVGDGGNVGFASYALAVVSHYRGGILRPDGPKVSTVTALTMDPVVATQRRRLR